MDRPDQAKGTIERLGLAFPVACGLDPREVSVRTGAFFEKEPGILQAAGFIVRRDGTVALAAYSTGAIGRLVAADCLGLIDFLREETVGRDAGP